MMRTKAFLLLVLAIAFAAGPFLIPGFGGFDPYLYPIPQDDPPVQPAGYAFAIWGIIYIWLVAHAAYGVFYRGEDPAWDRTRWPLGISLAIGTSWLAVAMVSPVWATILIFAMLITALIALFLAPADVHWWMRLPLGLYAGWLSAASFASLGLLGAGYGVAFGGFGWAILCVLLATIVGLTVQVRLGHTWTYGLAVGWALIAIAVKNWGDVWYVAVIALAGGLWALAAAFWAGRKTVSA